MLAPDGSVRENVIARLVRYAFVTFRSTHTNVSHDGRLEFSGELTVTHVTREQIAGAWNSAHGFPSYTDPVTTSTTRTATFVLTTPHAQFLGRHLQQQEAFVASTTIDAGAFAELSSALLDSYWPTVAQDQHCTLSADSGGRRDYNGAVCTGKAISVRNPPTTPSSFGRDYAGRKIEAPVNGNVTIVLYLKLGPPASEKAPGN
jgi:hypothetical protein